MKFFYINTGNSYPPNKHLIDGLRENNHEVFEINETGQDFGKYMRVAKSYWVNGRSCDVVIVGYPTPVFVPLMRFISLKKVILNAVSSQYEANVISRNTSKSSLLKILKWWTIDFVSFHLSSQVLLESGAQVDFVHKFFLVSRKKLVRAWMGVDEKEFFYDPSIKKRDAFTLLFRGRFLPESGILTVIETAKKLEDSDVQFLIIGAGFMYREVNALMAKLAPTNIEMINEKIPSRELREQMLSCHISLGQLADHPRLHRTLPCKLFESLALRLPYLTGRNAGALELLKEDETCFAVEPNSADDLAQKILFLKHHPDMLEKVARQGYELYKEKLTSKRLAEEVVYDCFK